MKKYRHALMAIALFAAIAGCVPSGGGGTGTPSVAVSLSLAGASNSPSGVAVNATPSGFPGSGPYVISYRVADEFAGQDLPVAGSELPVELDLSQFQVNLADDGGRSVMVTVEATYSRGGGSATGITTQLLCWISCSR